MSPCPFPITRLLVHRPPLLLLDGLRDVAEESCIAFLHLVPGAWYLDEAGCLPPWFGLEIMAQTISAFSGYHRARQGLPPRIGYLLGTRNFQILSSPAIAGETLETEVHLQYADDSGVCAFSCDLRLSSRTLARATLKAFEAP